MSSLRNLRGKPLFFMITGDVMFSIPLACGGRTRATLGPASELHDNEHVRAAYLGV